MGPVTVHCAGRQALRTLSPRATGSTPVGSTTSTTRPVQGRATAGLNMRRIAHSAWSKQLDLFCGTGVRCNGVQPHAPPLAVIAEYTVTRDEREDIDDGGWIMHPARPPGPGWRVHDASHDKRTTWIRFIVLAPEVGS